MTEWIAEDRIDVRGIKAFGHHGVLPSERENGQFFVVDVSLVSDTRDAAQSDDLANTINYADVASSVANIISGDAVDLIETLAQRIADCCLAFDRVRGVRVVVHKPSAPIDVTFDDVVVTIERSR